MAVTVLKNNAHTTEVRIVHAAINPSGINLLRRSPIVVSLIILKNSAFGPSRKHGVSGRSYGSFIANIAFYQTRFVGASYNHGVFANVMNNIIAHFYISKSPSIPRIKLGTSWIIDIVFIVESQSCIFAIIYRTTINQHVIKSGIGC